MAASKILITDDDVGTCETLSDIFQEKGYRVVMASRGNEAIEKASQTTFDVALIDIKLPDMDGMELIAVLREMQPDLAMILITGHASLETALRALNEGASAYIIKPLIMDEVLATIREALEKRRLVIENRSLYEEARRELAERKQVEERVLRKNAILDAINRVLLEALTCESDEEVARTCLDLAEELTGSRFGWIGEVNQAGRLDAIAQSYSGWEACKIPRSEALIMIKDREICGIWGRVLKDEQSQIVNDPGSHADRVGTPEGHPPLTSFLGVPFKHAGKTIGMIAIANKEAGYDTYDQEAIEALSIAFVEALLRKQSEEALKESEEKVRTMSVFAKDAIIMIDDEENISFWNEAAEKTFGYSSQEAMGNKCHKLIAPQRYHTAITEGLRKFKNTGQGPAVRKTLELEAIRKDGIEFPIELSISATKLKGKWNALGIVRDITERKLAEEALRAEKEKFRILVEESPLGISIIGKDGDYQYVNPKLVEMFGYTLKDIPTGWEWFRHAYPDPKYRDQVISTWITDIKEAKVGESRPRIFSVTCKDGSKKVSQFIPVTMETGDQIVVYEDTTEHEKLAAQLRQAQKMEAVGRLAGGVAHDFNNLLTTIIGNAEFALGDISKDSSTHENIAEIINSAYRAASLTRQLLAFSRKQILEPKVLNLNTVITDLKKMLRRLIGEDVNLETVFEPELMRVEIDSGQLEQVIMNLVINARDAMPQGGKITIETANVYLDEDYARSHGVEIKPGAHIMLSISDTGMGMDEETQSHIFEPFFTTKKEGKGTGLGLSTVYGIIKQTGGFIWVYSEPGQGTIFKIYLPGVEREAEPVKRETTPLVELKGSDTVLLVEDDDSLRNLVRRVLKRYGYNVLAAKNGEDALRVSEEHEGPINLMITDVVMPGMDGRELSTRLQPYRPELKILYMSGYTDNTIVERGVLAPGINFIEKPFSPESLALKIRKLLDVKQH